MKMYVSTPCLAHHGPGRFRRAVGGGSLPDHAAVGLVPLLDGYQQRLPGQERAGAGPGQNGGGHSHGTTDDGSQDAVVAAHKMSVDTKPVTNL